MIWLLMAACKKEEPRDVDRPDPPDPSPHSALHTGTIPVLVHSGSTGTTAETAHTAVETDCSSVPLVPVSVGAIASARGYHGLAFDQAGFIYGMDARNNLIQADYYGASSVFLPTQGTQGMDALQTGELAVATPSGLTIVDPTDASVRVVASSLSFVYGVVEGPDGMLYVGDRTNAYRVDPVNDTYEVYLRNSAAQSVGFSPDFTKFYYTNTTGWALWQVELDANYDPIGAPTQLSNFGSSFRDGLVVDLCGSIYVMDYGTNNMYKIDPVTGDNVLFFDFTFDLYGHGAAWGSGIGGWRRDAIYVPQPYNSNTVAEIVIGIEGVQ
jgi:hypothetical protein